ncbi:MAG: sigma-70 family RNA polymerase sigma factor [Candidatus Obscuribacterales bacterium]|nr:sigma-70 family RNA polymerase sigma factor [Candidatus Obscuribacterales bacterium]
MFAFGKKKIDTADSVLNDWVKQYSRELYQFAFLRVNKREDAEDLVQVTFIKAYRSYASFRTDSNPRAWLYAILANSIKDHLRKSGMSEISLEDESDLLSQLPDPANTPETALIEKDEQERQSQALARGIANLPEQFAAPLLLREVNDLSYKEIADLLSIPIGTVMSRLSRARNALFEIVNKESSAPPTRQKAGGEK